ncbi:MAG: GNAT family N-acetyltransferase [bacterium]|nr:GNAT family N-acetyltransferase [bacterium]
MGNIRKSIEYICKQIGHRAPGSKNEYECAGYLKERLEKMGLDVCMEEFDSPSHIATSSFLISVEDNKKFTSLPVQFSPVGKVEGELVFLGSADTPLPETEQIKGRIGLLLSETDRFTRHRTVISLEERGLIGLVVVSSHFGTIDTKVVREPDIKMPVVAVSMEDGYELKRYEGKKFIMSVEGEKEKRNKSQNVVVKIEGKSKEWFVIGAHYDSTPFIEGALDNASGTAVVLEVARILSQKRMNNTVYILFTGSKEYGGNDCTGRGAQNFFKRRTAEIKHCTGYIDVDGVGDITGIPTLIIDGNERFKSFVRGITLSQRYQIKKRESPGGDNGVAYQYGVPYIWFTDAILFGKNYLHTTYDRVELIDFDKLEVYVNDVVKVAEEMDRQGCFFPYLEDRGITIRQARFSDIPSILEITRLAFEGYSLGKIQEEFYGEKLGGKEWYEYKNMEVEGYFKGNIYCCIVAEIEGKIVGYATYYKDGERGIGTIGNNAVHPSYQGRGIGTLLQKEIKRRMEEDGFKRFSVSTLSIDIPAQKMYEKMGYKKVVDTIHYMKKQDKDEK